MKEAVEMMRRKLRGMGSGNKNGFGFGIEEGDRAKK